MNGDAMDAPSGKSAGGTAKMRIVFLDRPSVIVTPHTAWANDEAMQTLWDQMVDHLENFRVENRQTGWSDG